MGLNLKSKKMWIWVGIGVFLLICIGVSMSSEQEAQAERESNEIVLKPAKIEISGALRDCYEVVDREYKVKIGKASYESDAIHVEIKRTDKPLPYDVNDVTIYPDAHKSPASNRAGFGIEILDADGNVIDKKSASSTPYSWDEMKEALHLCPGDTGTIQFQFKSFANAASFRVTSIVEPNNETKSGIIDSATNLVDDAIDAIDKAAAAAVYDVLLK